MKMKNNTGKLNNKLHLLALSLIPEVRPDLLSRLLNHFGSAETAWKADKKRLESVPGRGPSTAEYLSRDRAQVDPLPVWEKIQKGID